jgi:phosphatidylserine/phosphatidylglycerophosphate/cardiolipin synthase-like enzyme
VVEAGGASATAFVLPDAPAVPVETLREADERLLLAGYTFGSPRVADALIRARERGIRVRVLLEGDPVGGTTRRQARLLDRLTDAGVAVRVVGGPHARYEYHHAKYAVVDDRALVLTENWKPAGTGGAASRGWGALVDDPELAAGLARTFRADAGWVDAVPWRRFRRGRSFEAIPPANGSFGGQFAPERLPVERARLLVAPDNAASEVVALLDGAEESIRVVGPTLGTDGRFLPALLRAARRGVRVQVLLSGTWYARAENERLAERLRERADAEDLPLTVRLAEPRGYAKIHAKGAVIDGRRVVLGSLNWNRHAATENREVVVVLSGERVAGYYARVFDADWGGGGSPLPVGVIAALGLAVLVALVVLRTVEFGGEAGPGAEGSQDGRPPPGV